jgi:ankyrin repeat protein
LLQQHGANPDLSLLAIAGDMRRRYNGAEGQLRVIRFLVEGCGANVNHRNDDGITPLAAAAREGYRDIVKYLLSEGADPDLEAPAWAKPLQIAEHRGHAGIVSLTAAAKPLDALFQRSTGFDI